MAARPLQGVLMVAMLLLGGCGGEAPNPGVPMVGERVPEDELPDQLTIEAEVLPPDPLIPFPLRRVRLELISPYDVPLDGLKWGRLERIDEAVWPKGWTIRPRTTPYGVETDGIPAGRRFVSFVEVIAGGGLGPRSCEFRYALDHRGADGARRTTRSNTFRLAFPEVASGRPVTEADLAGDIPENFSFVLSRHDAAHQPTTVEFPFGAFWYAGQDWGRYDSAEFVARLREARVWSLLSAPDDMVDLDPTQQSQAWLVVTLTAGDAHVRRMLYADGVREDPRWEALLDHVEQSTGVRLAE